MRQTALLPAEPPRWLDKNTVYYAYICQDAALNRWRVDDRAVAAQTSLDSVALRMQIECMPGAIRMVFAGLQPLASAITPHGDYDALKLAELLGWTSDDLAKFVERSPSTLYRKPASEALQDRLGSLAGLYLDLVQLLMAPPSADEDLRGALQGEHATIEPSAAARAWFRTSIQALDGKSPKERILEGDIASVRRLVAEYASGLAF